MMVMKFLFLFCSAVVLAAAQRTTVTLLVFSGSINPRWELSVDQASAIQQLISEQDNKYDTFMCAAPLNLLPPFSHILHNID